MRRFAETCEAVAATTKKTEKVPLLSESLREELAAVGQAIGAGVGLAMFVHAAAIDFNEIDEWGPQYLGFGAAFTGIGAGIGCAIDFAQSKPHVRFAAPSTGTMTIRAAPLF